MTRPELWFIILGGMVATYLIRLSFIALLPHERLPALFRRGLTYVPPAILSALIFPEILRTDGYLDLSPGNPRLLAGIVAALVAWRTRSVWLTILLGMAALWLFSSLLSGSV